MLNLVRLNIPIDISKSGIVNITKETLNLNITPVRQKGFQIWGSDMRIGNGDWPVT